MTHAPEKREPWHGIAAGEGGDLERPGIQTDGHAHPGRDLGNCDLGINKCSANSRYGVVKRFLVAHGGELSGITTTSDRRTFVNIRQSG